MVFPFSLTTCESGFTPKRQQKKRAAHLSWAQLQDVFLLPFALQNGSLEGGTLLSSKQSGTISVPLSKPSGFFALLVW